MSVLDKCGIENGFGTKVRNVSIGRTEKRARIEVRRDARIKMRLRCKSCATNLPICTYIGYQIYSLRSGLIISFVTRYIPDLQNACTI
jgi:hypothetical protein